jgi:uncharacterized membrane protein
MLWKGTAASAVDLNPSGSEASEANGVSAAGQVGDYDGPATGGSDHAVLWQDTAASALDLHLFLNGLGPAFTDSYAYAITDDGTIVGRALDANSVIYAIVWTPVPEPSSCELATSCLVVIGIMCARRRVPI